MPRGFRGRQYARRGSDALALAARNCLEWSGNWRKSKKQFDEVKLYYYGSDSNVYRDHLNLPMDQFAKKAGSPNERCWWEELVRDRVSSLRFGSVQIVLHDSQVVQVEITERIRGDQPPAPHSKSSTSA